MEKMTHEEYVATRREHAVELARDILAGKRNTLEAVRELASLRYEVEVPDDDPDFMAFVAIEDGFEHLPIGSQRTLWSREALESKADEIARWEKSAKEDSQGACLNIIERFAAK